MLVFFTYFIMAITLIASFFVVFATNPIHSVFFLITVFLLTSIFLVLHGFYFFATVLIIVYVGAVSVLFLFVVMMLETKKTSFEMEHTKSFIIKLFFIINIIIGVSLWWMLDEASGKVLFFDQPLIHENFQTELMIEELGDSLQIIGTLMYTHFWFLFIMVGVVLFLVIYLVISLTKSIKTNQKTFKRQVSFIQVYKNFNSTVHLVSKFKKK